MSPRKPRTFTSQQLLKLSVTSGISTALVRFLRSPEVARELAETITAEARDCIRQLSGHLYLIEPDTAGYRIRFHLEYRPEPPPVWQVVEDCAKRHVKLEHIVEGGYQEGQ